MGTDCTLEYLVEGDLAGYTLLTVGSPPVPGDANRDGQVDGSDATILATYWQTGVNNNTNAVPEPGCVVLLAMLLFIAGFMSVARKRIAM